MLVYTEPMANSKPITKFEAYRKNFNRYKIRFKKVRNNYNQQLKETNWNI
jgi:hypothetical protein